MNRFGRFELRDILVGKVLQLGDGAVHPVLLVLLALELAAAQDSIGHQNASLRETDLLRALTFCMNRGPNSPVQTHPTLPPMHSC